MPEVIGVIKPANSADFETHEDTYGKGGFRVVATITERDNIPQKRRKEGMRVIVLDDGLGIRREYSLVGGLLNGNWQEYTTAIGDIDGGIYT